MEDFKKIGLNIWGIRGGYRCFCHTDNIDVETPEIANTWKDIREFLYVTDLTIRFYALEYTQNYKVFTLYRPENDTSRTGAYVATTLYVPHTLKINRILDLMQQISNAYHKDHYDAFGNPNSNPDYVQYYAELIKNYAGNIVKETDVRSWEASAQDNTPYLLPYTTPSVVEEFFDKPYRKEFLAHQEVMFWKNEYLQNQQSHGLKFQKAETLTTMFELDGKNIAPQFEGGSIRNKPQDFSIERFVREGVDITQNWPSCFFYDKTTIDVVLKKPFHQPYTYHGSMVSFDSPFVKRGDDYEFRPRVDFKSRQYEIPVNVVNVGNTSFDLYFGDQRVGISGGRGVFRLDGSQANNNCKVTLGLNGNNATKVADFAMSKFFTAGTDEPDRLQPCIIESLKQVRFQFNQDCRGMLNIRRGGGSMGFSTSNKTFETIMLATTKASDLEIVVDGYKTELKALDANGDAYEVTLTRQNLVVDVIVAEPLKPYLFPDNIILKVGGSSYKGTHFIVPFGEKDSQWKFGLVADNKGHTLECHFERKPNGDDVVICPMLSMLKNGTNETLKLNAPNTVFDVFANTTILVPADYTVDLKDSDKYDIAVQTDYSGVKTTVITDRPMASTASTTMPLTPNPSITSTENASGYQGGNNYGGYQRPSQENQKYYGNDGNRGQGGTGSGDDGGGKKKRWFLFGGGLVVILALLAAFVWPGFAKGGSKERKLVFKKIEGFSFNIINFEPEKSGYKLYNEDTTMCSLDKKCEKVIVQINKIGLKGENTIYYLKDTLKINDEWFTKANNYTYTYSYQDRIAAKEDEEQTKKNEEQKKRACDSTYICKQFEKYLDKVWSMKCSLKMLDSLQAWNDSINKCVVKGDLMSSNPNFKAKKDILGKVTQNTRENNDGSDWVTNLIKNQKAFFKNLRDKENVTQFGTSKRSFFSTPKRQYFREDQQKIIQDIKEKDPFDVAHAVIGADSVNMTYDSIQYHLNQSENK